MGATGFVRPAAAFASHRFVVQQDRVGMKVSVDAIVLAASAALSQFGAAAGAGAAPQAGTRVLDVGCGCGILALLLRQAACAVGCPVEVSAIDIDPAAAEQAR